MSKVSGEILINRLSSRFRLVVDQRNEPIYNPRSADELVLGGSPEGTTTAAAWPPSRPPWASVATNDLDRAQDPAGGIWPRPGIDRAVIKNRVDDLRWSDVVDGC